jgi:hypothetical protein
MYVFRCRHRRHDNRLLKVATILVIYSYTLGCGMAKTSKIHKVGKLVFACHSFLRVNLFLVLKDGRL